jgi:hypothetical protein
MTQFFISWRYKYLQCLCRQPAYAMRGTRARMQECARSVWRENTKLRRDLQPARAAGPASTRQRAGRRPRACARRARPIQMRLRGAMPPRTVCAIQATHAAGRVRVWLVALAPSRQGVATRSARAVGLASTQQPQLRPSAPTATPASTQQAQLRPSAPTAPPASSLLLWVPL